LFALYLHRLTRPQDGFPDPHWHIHALLMNGTHDDEESRWKATQIGKIVAAKGMWQAAFHSLVAEKALAAGYTLRRTQRDFEMDIFAPEEIRAFCRRTEAIKEVERRQRISRAQERGEAARC
jgi:conjugative relaxase-like TrwC/TraI family protein